MQIDKSTSKPATSEASSQSTLKRKQVQAKSLITSFGDQKIQPSTKIQDLQTPSVEEIVKRQLNMTAGMNVSYALKPCLTIEPDPQFWYQREELYRAVALQNDPALSRRKEELFPIWASPSSDLLGRMGYTSATDIVSLYGDDSPTALAAKVIARIEAEAWSLSQDLFWVMGLIKMFQSMPGTGWGKLMLSRLSTSRANTAISTLAGIPIPGKLKAEVLKAMTPSARVVANANPVNNTIIYRIPTVIYGVMHDWGNGKFTNPKYAANGDYDNSYNSGAFVDDKGELQGAPSLVFSVCHPTSNAAINYGWNFAQVTQSLNHAYEYPNVGKTLPSDSINYASDKLGLTSSSLNALSYRLCDSLILHLKCIAMRLHAIWGMRTGSLGSKANQWIGNLSFDADNSTELYDTLTSKDTGLFDEVFDPYKYFTEVAGIMMKPLDDTAVIKDQMTINAGISKPVRAMANVGKVTSVKDVKQSDLKTFTSMFRRSSDTIFEGDIFKSRASRTKISLNTLQYRVTSFYKSLAFEMSNYVDKYHNYWQNYTNVVNRSNQEWLPNPDTITFRPDISISLRSTVKPEDSSSWEDNNNEFVVTQIMPVALDDSDPSKDTSEKKRKVYTPFEGFCDPVKSGNDVSLRSTHKMMDSFMLNSTRVSDANEYSDLGMQKNDFASLVGAFKVSGNADTFDKYTSVSSRQEWLKLISGLDSAKVYASEDEAKSFFTFAESDLFVDVNLAMEEMESPTVERFGTDGTVYKAIAFNTLSGDVISSSTASSSIRPWTPRTMWNGTSADWDPAYCQDYKIESSVAEVTPVVRKVPDTLDNPQWTLIPVCFDEPIVNLYNYTIGNEVLARRFFGGGALDGDANKMDGILYAFQLMARAIELTPTRLNSQIADTDGSSKNDLIKQFILADDVGAITSNGYSYHKFIASRVYARWNQHDIESAIFGLPAFDAYPVKITAVGSFDSKTFSAIRANMINYYTWHIQNGMFTAKRGSMLGISKTNTAASSFSLGREVYDVFESDAMKKGEITISSVSQVDGSGAIDFIQYPFDNYTKRISKLDNNTNKDRNSNSNNNKKKNRNKPRSNNNNKGRNASVSNEKVEADTVMVEKAASTSTEEVKDGKEKR